jgi:hypothetical protein
MFINQTACFTDRKDRYTFCVIAATRHKGLDGFQPMRAALIVQSRQCPIYGRRCDIRLGALKLLKDLISSHWFFAGFQNLQDVRLPRIRRFSHAIYSGFEKFLFYKILTIKRPSLQARGNQPMR